MFNADRIALLFVSRHNYHKLPGGGIESGESVKEALEREITEETGCKAEIEESLGSIRELGDDFGIKQISYCFIARVSECDKETSFTEKEKRQGFQLKWVTLDEAISLIGNDKPNNYEGRFIVRRDMEFLKKAKRENI